MSNPIRPSDCPSVLGVHAHFHVSDYSLLDNETKEGKRAGPTTVCGQAAEDTAQQTADRYVGNAADRGIVRGQQHSCTFGERATGISRRQAPCSAFDQTHSNTVLQS